MLVGVLGLAMVGFGADVVPTVYVSDEGQAIPVEQMRCSAMPVNIRWPGHQRELDQTEICHFARFDFRGETQVRVSVPDGTREVVVRPVAKKVAVSREGDFAAFTLRTPGAGRRLSLRQRLDRLEKGR